MEQYSDCINIQTEKLIVKIYDGGFVDIYDKNGTVLCLDYRGEQNLVQTVDKETKKLMEQEGHHARETAEIHKIKVVKKIHGDECFYGLGDKTGFLNKRGYEYINWNTDNPQPHVDSFKKLYKSIPFSLL